MIGPRLSPFRAGLPCDCAGLGWASGGGPDYGLPVRIGRAWVNGVTDMAAQRLLIEGRVQRVGYRDWAVRTARQLGIVGWVRNLQDGRVEILADGEDVVLDSFIDQCRGGPNLARVDRIDAQPAELGNVKGFTKRFTA